LFALVAVELRRLAVGKISSTRASDVIREIATADLPRRARG
jgi:hypothetical protein